MPQDFGSLLRYYRKDRNDLTQEGLAEELKLELDTDVEYSKTDISKWEKGKRIPAEHVVAVLDKILSANGVLSKAAGYAAQLPEAQQRAQNDLSLLQMEHLARLQEVAKSLVDGVSEVIESIKGMNREQFEEPGVENLVDAFARIKYNSLWPSIKGHIGASGEKIEIMLKEFSQNVCNWALYGWPYTYESDFNKFKQKLERHVLIRISPLSDFANFGLLPRTGHHFNETCPYCPDQKK